MSDSVFAGFSQTTVTRLRKLAKRLRSISPAEFAMDEWLSRRRRGKNWCGTAACVAGHTVLMIGMKPAQWAYYREEYGNSRQISDECRNGQIRHVGLAAREWLGLDDMRAEKLFFSDNWPKGFDPTLPESAARRVEHFIQTGE